MNFFLKMMLRVHNKIEVDNEDGSEKRLVQVIVLMDEETDRALVVVAQANEDGSHCNKLFCASTKRPQLNLLRMFLETEVDVVSTWGPHMTVLGVANVACVVSLASAAWHCISETPENNSDFGMTF